MSQSHYRVPLALLGGFALVCIALLIFPLRLPLGAHYWDLYTYVDAAYRIEIGQLPNVDFFVPVGPLGYYLYLAVTKIFPQAHTLLAVHFSVLIIALPIMAVIVAQSAQKSRREALLLTIPFIIFGLLPVNTVDMYQSPGLDGFGNYNRHGALLLYVLACAFLFVDNKKLAAVLGIIVIVTLFLIKITAAIIGAILLILAVVAGRASVRLSAIAVLACTIPLLILEWRTALISNYVSDIVHLVRMNTEFLQTRIFTVLSLKFNVILPAAFLILMVAWQDRDAIFRTVKGLLQSERWTAFRALANHDAMWLLALLIGGTTYEKQNTGSHELILLWPAIVMLMRRYPLPWDARTIPVVALAAFVVIPTPVAVLHRAVRVVASMPKYEPVAAPLLGPIARVSVKPEIIEQARAFLANYIDNRAGFERLASRNVLPSYIVFSEIDFYVNWMVTSQQAAEAVLRYEAENKVRLEKIMTLDFVDVLPFMLKRTPLRGVSIGNDPDRTLANTDATAMAEIEAADALLVPLCPPTNARNSIFLAYTKKLGPRDVVALTPCFNMLVKQKSSR